MNDRTQGALLLAVGGIAVRLGLTDAALAYVKAGLPPFLVAAGLVLIALGAGALRRAFASPRPAPEPTSGDDVEAGHEHGPAAAWLLVLPLFALLLIAPPALGSFAAERQSARPAVTSQTDFSPLPDPVDGAVELRLLEYVLRALYDEDGSLEGERVRLVSFVTRAGGDDTYHLTRFRMACCAADATAISVEVAGDRSWPADTWLEVEGHWESRAGADEDGDSRVPLLRAASSREIPEPVQTYEQ
jgi:uncharacterized repeat protein (TIGR03943 family)